MNIIRSRGKSSNFAGTVIAVDQNKQTVTFCTAAEGGSALITSSADIDFSSCDKEFFEKLAEIAAERIVKNTEAGAPKVSLILPDGIFLLDTVNIPVIHRKAMQQSLSLAIEAVYNNAADLSLMTYAIQQNKDAATFGLVGIRREILDFANNAFDSVGLPISRITYAASAMSNGAMTLNGKLKNDTFLLLDIKEGVSRFAFVVRGCTMGYYELPFGHEIMHRTRVVSEDALFDNRAGTLLVLNSKERARAKHLTDIDEIFANGEGSDSDASAEEASRSGKRLRQFIQRPEPRSEEECVYENFRIFLKWALELINNNRDILSLAKLDTVYINMPDEYKFLFDIVNQKHSGRAIAFAPLISGGVDASITENLELYGGFFMDSLNEANTF